VLEPQAVNVLNKRDMTARKNNGGLWSDLISFQEKVYLIQARPTIILPKEFSCPEDT
jgi:hypothetical protein